MAGASVTATYTAGAAYPPGTEVNTATSGAADGTFRVWALLPGTYTLNVTSADGSGRTRLTTNPGPDSDPAWSPDGRTIAFVSGRDGNTGIYVMNADGTEQRLLMPAKVDYPPQLAWSPDGQKLAFTVALTSGPDGNLEIYVMNADGSGQRNLTPTNSADDGAPRWSPDGRRIVFVGSRDGGEAIYVMNADGSGQQRLTGGGG